MQKSNYKIFTHYGGGNRCNKPIPKFTSEIDHTKSGKRPEKVPKYDTQTGCKYLLVLTRNITSLSTPPQNQPIL